MINYKFLSTIRLIWIGFNFIYSHKGCTHFTIHKYSIIQSLCAILYGFLDFFQKHGGFCEDLSKKQNDIPGI